MKNRVVVSLLLVGSAALAGCAGATAPQSGPSPVPSTHVPFDCLDPAYSESVATEPFECKAFISAEGSAPGQDLSWIASMPLHASFGHMNGSLAMVVRMPCGVLNVPVAIGAGVVTPDVAGMVQSADGCIGQAAEYRAWTTAFVKTPMAYSLDNQSLVLANDLGQIKFKRS
ncbi:hypothetical protein ACQCSX_20655 [Pseudarthrobacter sp. P1]|uniref:hypothetical protein n=1 Tax=Pseudarthrobacter sp. P1 TaxID=3418418 RepID=UPI003CEE165B